MTVLDFLFFFLSFYSFVLLCYIPFTDRLGRDKRKILRETALMCVVLSALPSCRMANSIGDIIRFIRQKKQPGYFNTTEAIGGVHNAAGD